MNQDEYEALRPAPAEPTMAVPTVTAGVVDYENRTLAYGYDVDRNSFHVYAHEGVLYVWTYTYARIVLARASGPALPADILVPDKRVYPQYTDVRFARLMRELGSPLPLGNWSEPRREGPYFGWTHLDGGSEGSQG